MGVPDIDVIDDPIGVDLLKLVFMACHPVLSTEAQISLTLRCLGGLTTDSSSGLLEKEAPGHRRSRAHPTMGHSDK